MGPKLFTAPPSSAKLSRVRRPEAETRKEVMELTYLNFVSGGTIPETDGAVELKMDRGIAFVREREILLRGAMWYVTVDVSVTEHAKIIGGLRKGLEDLIFTAGRDTILRQELRYVSSIVEELQAKIDNIIQMLPREQRIR